MILGYFQEIAEPRKHHSYCWRDKISF